jgi:hypothetical protein
MFDLPDDNPMLWLTGTFVLRLGEAVIAAVSDLFVGVLIAGLLRHIVGDERLQNWFAKPWSTALAAVALPVGFAGILPIAVVLRRAGVRTAAVVAVLLLGGAVGPLSLAYLMERATPLAAFVLVAMLVATTWVVFLVLPKSEAEPVGDDTAGLLPALAEAKPLLAAVSLPLMIGLIVFAGVAAFLPPSFGGHVMHEPELAHLLAAIVLPVVGVYPPTIASLFSGESAAGVYPGAAWTMLLGSGLSLGSFVLLLTLVPRRSAFIAIGLLVASLVVGFFGLHVTPRLVPLASEDSHAFDRLSRPFHLLDGDAGPVASIVNSWRNDASAGLLLVAVILVTLVFLPKPSQRRAGHASTGLLRGLAVAGGLAWIVGTLYVYYPSAETVLAKMRYGEGYLSAAIGEGDKAAAEASLDRIDQLARRGGIGSRLRLDTTACEHFAALSAAIEATRPKIRQGDATHRDVADVFAAATRTRRLVEGSS